MNKVIFTDETMELEVGYIAAEIGAPSKVMLWISPLHYNELAIALDVSDIDILINQLQLFKKNAEESDIEFASNKSQKILLHKKYIDAMGS